jgi:hypothetical protein
MADEHVNGANGAANGAAGPDEYATFRIGGRDLKVGALTLWDLEQSRADLQDMNPDTPWTQYATTVVRIIARKLRPDAWEPFAESLAKSCTGPEARNLTSSFNDLWRVSGLMGEAEAAQEETTVSPGTGTLTESPPNSPLPSANQTSDD